MNDKDKSSKSFTKIEPTRLNLNADSKTQTLVSAKTEVKSRTWLPAVGLVALLGMLYLVVFWLPENVEAPKQVNLENIPAKKKQKIKPIESPFEQAQLAKHRKESQDLLAKLLEKQNRLESINVESWAKDDFTAALATAEEGDQNYRIRKFEEAQVSYNEAIDQLNVLLLKEDEIFSEALKQGQQALINGDAETGINAFTQALLINSESREAQEGLARAEVLDDVLALIDQSEKLTKSKDLEKRLELMSKANELDPFSKDIPARIQSIKEGIIQRDFNAAMTQGFAALSQQKFEDAITAFNQGLALMPKNPQASEALEQTINQKNQKQIQALIAEAKSKEAIEDWQSALDSYTQAVNIDATVVDALVGQIKTKARADLDTKLDEIIEAPDKLSAESIYKNSEKLLADAEQVANAGPVLSTQIQTLKKHLREAKIPVKLSIQSDNMTQVKLYRVGELGIFYNKELSLKPGKYTLVGIRNGYRDVRMEVVLAPKSNDTTITIQCEEKIVNG